MSRHIPSHRSSSFCATSSGRGVCGSPGIHSSTLRTRLPCSGLGGVAIPSSPSSLLLLRAFVIFFRPPFFLSASNEHLLTSPSSPSQPTTNLRTTPSKHQQRPIPIRIPQSSQSQDVDPARDTSSRGGCRYRERCFSARLRCRRRALLPQLDCPCSSVQWLLGSPYTPVCPPPARGSSRRARVFPLVFVFSVVVLVRMTCHLLLM